MAGMTGKEQLEDLLARPGKASEEVPTPFYNRDGDSVHFVFRDVPMWRDRVDGFLTILRDQSSDTIVGFIVKGVRRIAMQLCDMVGDVAPDTRTRKVAMRIRTLLGLLLSRTPLHPEQGNHFQQRVYELLQTLNQAQVADPAVDVDVMRSPRSDTTKLTGADASS